MTGVIGITANRLVEDRLHCEYIRQRYIEALRIAAGLEVVVLPTGKQEPRRLRDILQRLDGLVLTGDESNIDPFYYNGTRQPESYKIKHRDPYRDELSFSALEVALELNMPLLGICRGLQELNVYFDGTLYEDLAVEKPGILHYEDVSLPRDMQYEQVHMIEVQPGGWFQKFAGTDVLRVNSLHNQGIKTLGKNLRVEAVCMDDGLIEAVSIIHPHVMQVAVQWHPEWHFRSNLDSQRLFQAFGGSCREYAKNRDLL